MKVRRIAMVVRWYKFLHSLHVLPNMHSPSICNSILDPNATFSKHLTLFFRVFDLRNMNLLRISYNSIYRATDGIY